jgi:hypothetical protein
MVVYIREKKILWKTSSYNWWNSSAE